MPSHERNRFVSRRIGNTQKRGRPTVSGHPPDTSNRNLWFNGSLNGGSCQSFDASQVLVEGGDETRLLAPGKGHDRCSLVAIHHRDEAPKRRRLFRRELTDPVAQAPLAYRPNLIDRDLGLAFAGFD